MYKLSKNSTKHLKGIKQNLIILVKRSLKKSPHDIGIPVSGGFRTAQFQNNLFHQRPKVTQLDGFKRKSYHQTGNAFDIFIYDEHKACWSCLEKYKEVSDVIKAEFEIMKEEGIFRKDQFLIWGGDWKRFKDRPHFQINE